MHCAEPSRKDRVPGHRVNDPGSRVEAGQGQREEADHRAGREWELEGAHVVEVGQSVQWGAKGVQGLGLTPGAEHLDVAHQDEEQAGKDEAPDHCSGNGVQGVAGLGAECGGAFKADHAENAGDDGQAHAAHGHSLKVNLSGVDRVSVLEQHDGDQRQDAHHRKSLKDEGQHGGQPDIFYRQHPAEQLR
jgi:hypothetical protein